MKPFLLYHWSPKSRRKSIKKYGLCPGSISRCRKWKPPYVCFSNTPSLAWALSGALDNKEREWDLWMTWSDIPSGYELLQKTKNQDTAEYRVYERIYKRDIWYVGTRENSAAIRKM
jgi:hypothetical protein